jgi:uncharacterized protein (DUF1684 family)
VTTSQLDLADWRRRVGELYAAVRTEKDAETGHQLWRSGRDELFRHHPQSPLPADDPLRDTGLPYWPYNPDLRFELELHPTPEPAQLSLSTDGDHLTQLTRIGYLELPAPLSATLDVWWLEQYAGGIFLPVRDGSAGSTSYGGGRYALDTTKGADLGGSGNALVVDLNFLYHPSCRYDPAWQCPLAPIGNTFAAPVLAGEKL